MVDVEKRNARRRELYAQDAEHRARRRQQAEVWKDENRETYLEQQREAAVLRREQFPEQGKAAHKKYYDKDPQKRLAATKEWRAKNPGYHSRWHAANKKKNPVLYMWRNCKNRAKALGIEFTLEQSDIVIPDVCPALGIKLAFNHGKQGFFCNESPSVDRFDNSKGYTKDNIRIISWRANMLKRDASLAELKAIVAYMERQ